MSETAETSDPMPATAVSATPEAAPKTSSGWSGYPPVTAVPTQSGPEGLRYDFNLGARVMLPEGNWHVRLRDIETGNIVFDRDASGALASSVKRYFVPFRIEVSRDGKEIFTHDYDARGREVLVQFPIGTLGDMLAWFPYVARFAAVHGCRLSVALGPLIIPLLRDAYPEITFLTHEEVDPSRYYATYRMGLFFDDIDTIWQPCDFRLVGLHRTAGYILGVDPTEEPPRLTPTDDERPLAEPYVCIATQATSQAKYWNNPEGWRAVVAFLKQNGFRVVCIDQRPAHGHGIVWNQIPHGVEDLTGNRPLLERVRWLRHAAFFIGLGSGLSWLAWAARTPVVMISGFSHPSTEFDTPYRVINYHTCNSCWNDPKYKFDHKDFLWCPRLKDTPRMFECTRLITVDHVIRTIRKVPAFVEQAVPPDR